MTGAALSGDDDGNAADARVIPNPLQQKAVTASVGIVLTHLCLPNTTKIGSDVISVIKSDLKSVNMSDIAYKVTDQMSIGAGLVQYIDELTSAVDFGSIGFLRYTRPAAKRVYRSQRKQLGIWF
jgi:hypothetical protein